MNKSNFIIRYEGKQRFREAKLPKFALLVNYRAGFEVILDCGSFFFITLKTKEQQSILQYAVSPLAFGRWKLGSMNHMKSYYIYANWGQQITALGKSVLCWVNNSFYIFKWKKDQKKNKIMTRESYVKFKFQCPWTKSSSTHLFMCCLWLLSYSKQGWIDREGLACKT